MTDLFEIPENPSPMEEWRARHAVNVYPTQAGFRAANLKASAHGETVEAALLAWADKARVKCWKAEELEKMKSQP